MADNQSSNKEWVDRSVVPTSANVAECISELNRVVEGLQRLTSAIIGVIMGLDEVAPPKREIDRDVGAAVVLLCQGAGSSVAAIQDLAAPGLRTRECYLMARSVVESYINCCYILAEGPPAAESAMRHARQKAFRDLNRKSEIGNSKIRIALSDMPDVEDIEGMTEALSEYTFRSGKEDVRWTKKSVDDRIQIAGERFGESVLNRLHVARFAVYRHSSEIIHGTVFGAMFFHGLTMSRSQSQGKNKYADHLAGQHVYLLLSVVLATSAFIRSFHEAYGIDEIHSAHQELLEVVKNIPYFKRDKEGASAVNSNNSDE